MFLDYKEHKEVSCVRGNDIYKWADGTTSYRGKETDISKCKEECSKHTECAGFVSIENKGCGYWKRAIFTFPPGTSRSCYEKIISNNLQNKVQ